MHTRRRTAWLALGWLAVLLAQVVVLTHDAAATQHADDTLCQICLAGHSVGAAVAGEAPPSPPSAAAPPPPNRFADSVVQHSAAPWQARAPPALP